MAPESDDQTDFGFGNLFLELWLYVKETMSHDYVFVVAGGYVTLPIYRFHLCGLLLRTISLSMSSIYLCSSSAVCSIQFMQLLRTMSLSVYL